MKNRIYFIIRNGFNGITWDLRGVKRDVFYSAIKKITSKKYQRMMIKFVNEMLNSEPNFDIKTYKMLHHPCNSEIGFVHEIVKLYTYIIER
jgi:hypothetical protein